MNIVDIKNAIGKKLGALYPDHTFYAEEVRGNFERPSFFVYFVPVETMHHRYNYATSILVKMDYYSADETNDANWRMADELTAVFQKGLVVDGTHLDITRTNHEIVEDELVFTIPLTYHNGIEMLAIVDEEGNEQLVEEDESLGYTQEEIQLMQELELEEE